MNSARSKATSPYWTRRTEEEATGDSPLADRYREEDADRSNAMGRKAVVLPFKPVSARMGWLELALCILAMTGVFISILPGFHPREWQASGSDLKTLYASAVCFRQHIDAYSFQNIAAVFRVNNVVPPENWYAHAPVYPPFTLATLAPLTFIPMVDAVYLWLIMGTLALACATFSLVRAAAVAFQLSLPWRALLIALAAAFPLASFSLEMCNVSCIVAALCVTAVAMPMEKSSSINLRAVAVCLALLLKPHLAIWFVVALAISGVRADRRLAIRAVGLFSVVCVVIVIWMAAQHQLGPQVASYRGMVLEETHGGSMAPSNEEIIGIAAQITSLASLLGYWISSTAGSVLAAGLLVIFATVLLASTWPHADDTKAARLSRIAAWCAFGLIATYHRAHDGTMLLVLLPYVVARLRSNWHDWFAWSYLAFAAAAGWAPSLGTFDRLASLPGMEGPAYFLAYRQAALACLLLFLLLLSQVYWQRVQLLRTEYESEQETSEDELRAAG